MEYDLPIDIHTGKLVDWLVSRRHVKKNWPQMVQQIREKINNAIQDMPEHPDITKLLSGSYINYFHCLQIIDILKETEKESKNIFGWYSSQRMKDWQQIVYLYEADNVYLAEASQFLVRNVQYEIPSLKKQINKCRKIQEECDKKIEEAQKGSTSLKDKYYSECKRIGVTGDNLKEEFLGLLDKLPERFTAIGEKAKGLLEARQYYEDFIQYVLDPEETCLPLLKFVIENGDATVYQWRYGDPPLHIEREDAHLIARQTMAEVEPPPECVTNMDEIDFGEDPQLETGDIDWGDPETPQDVPLEIDFGEVDVENFGIEVESSGMEGGTARGDEAVTVLYSEPLRSQFINELRELSGFLTQRLIELESDESIVSMSMFSDSTKRSLQYQNPGVIGEFVKIIAGILQELNTPGMIHLYMICSSPRYVNRLIDTLERRLRDSERLLASLDPLREKKSKARHEEFELTKQQKLIAKRTEELQKQIEEDVSRKYKNRTVNLMGGISQVL